MNQEDVLEKLSGVFSGTKKKFPRSYQKEYDDWFCEAITELYGIALTNPKGVVAKCKQIEKQCKRKKDKMTMKIIRNQRDPAQYLLHHYEALFPILEEQLK